MPNDQPSNAPDHTAPAAHDRDDAAAVLSQTGQDDAPGGGGLIGSAADAVPVARGATTPNSPIDTGIASDGDAATDARQRSLADDPAAPR